MDSGVRLSNQGLLWAVARDKKARGRRKTNAVRSSVNVFVVCVRSSSAVRGVKGAVIQTRIQGGAGSGAHPWEGGTRAEGAGSFFSRAERRDTGVP